VAVTSYKYLLEITVSLDEIVLLVTKYFKIRILDYRNFPQVLQKPVDVS